MRRIFQVSALAFAILAGSAVALQSASAEPHKVLRIAKIGGEGGYDYVYADVAGRRLYVPRTGLGPIGRIAVYNLDSLEQVGEIAGANARGVAVDPKSHHGFGTSKPVVMWDTKTLAKIKTIDVAGNPDGILFDPFNQRVYVLSHSAPNVTVINAADGTVAGTIDLGGAPEQAVTDGKGNIYIDVEDKNQVAVVNAKTLMVTARYDLAGKGGTPAGLAFDVKNKILFVACRNPATMVMLKANDGKIIATLPIGAGVDGATFNPDTMEVYSSQGDGTLTIVKEQNPTSFFVEQNVLTPPNAKTLTLDRKTNRVLLIAAEFGPPAAPPPEGQRPARGPMVADSFSIVTVGK